MTSKERLECTLAHKAPDRIPMDFGGTAVTGIHVSVVAALRRHFSIGDGPVRVTEPYQMLGEVDDSLRDAMGIDTVGVTPRNTMFGFPSEKWREFRLPWGQVVLVPEGFRTTSDNEGNLYIYPEGDTSVSPSGKMPRSGFFFDAIIRQDPIDEERMDPRDNMEDFTPISDADLKHFEQSVDKAAKTGRAVVATFGGTAFGDIALVPGINMKHPRGVREIADWYMLTTSNPDYVHAVFEHQCETALKNLRKIHALVGNRVSAVFVCGTDFGTQTSQFCSPDTFRSLYAPYYKRINSWIHQNTTWKSFKHSCGSVEVLINDFINAGFDILNPVQIAAAGMDPGCLKEKYGDRIVFWGGGIDTQKTLPFGTPAQVKAEVLRLCRIFGKDGGFVFNTVHNIQANTPVENVVAMIKALRESERG
jgi:hypothetical protein